MEGEHPTLGPFTSKESHAKEAANDLNHSHPARAPRPDLGGASSAASSSRGCPRAQAGRQGLPPCPVCLNDVLHFIHAAGLEKHDALRAELTPDTHKFDTQIAMVPAGKSFPNQTPPPRFLVAHNLDGLISIEHQSIYTR